MANHKSAIKRMKQSESRRLLNASIRSSVKTEIKSIVKAVEKKEQDGAKAALIAVIPKISKAAAKGIFHKRNASRKISRLTRKVNALQATA
ncbi:MAG: 30S ribosomal protein S20 [Syntrophales bacterium]|nr:30S ribosomal protein S20 [Syntrophales bacterium]MCK9390660.1 30S ribosomal protein S20 [Syntrophales bacterium]